MEYLYRTISGAPRYAPNCTLRREVGSSLMKTRVVKNHIHYMQTALQGSNELVNRVMHVQLEMREKYMGSTWATEKYMGKDH